MSVPADIQARFANFMARMLSRGVAVPVQVYGKTSVYNGAGAAVGRQTQLLSTLSAYEDLGGGSADVRQEGKPFEDTTAIYFAPDASLTPANFSQRWVVIPGESPRQYRILACQSYGPYTMASLVAGGVSDAAGNTK
jgi:hypothetical protein